MYNTALHKRVKELIQTSRISDEMKENYLAILPILPKEKVERMVQLLEKAKLLTKKLNLDNA